VDPEAVEFAHRFLPEQFGTYLKQDIERWAKLAQATHIKVD